MSQPQLQKCSYVCLHWRVVARCKEAESVGGLGLVTGVDTLLAQLRHYPDLKMCKSS
jgi:hypothetical protein